MKKILQAMDGAVKPAVKADDDMKRFVSIIAEGKGSLNRPTQAEQITTQHYAKKSKPVIEQKKSTTSIDKYFKAVEQELLESQNSKKDKVRRLAERVIERVIPGQETPPGINRLTGKPIEPGVASSEPLASAPMPGANLPKADRVDKEAGTITVTGKDYKLVMLEPGGIRPRGGTRIAIPQAVMGERGIGNYIGIIAGNTAYVLPMSEQENIKEVGGNYGHASKMRSRVAQTKTPPEDIISMAKQGARQQMQREETEGVDSVTLDIPLFIRLMEFAREDAQDDMVLHQIAEKLIGMAEEGQSLSMSDYENIVGSKSIDEACWKNYKQIGMKKKGGRTVPNCVPKK